MDVNSDAFRFVTHSMGGVFAAGMQRYLKERGWKIDQTVFINTYQSEKVHIETSDQFIVEYQNTDDFVINTFDPLQRHSKIDGTDVLIKESSNQSFNYSHSYPIGEGMQWWEKLREILNALNK